MPMKDAPVRWLTAALAVALISATRLPAQSFRWGGTEFNASRKISIPSEEKYSIVVTQFFHHGEISPDGKNVIVLTQDKKAVPTRVLQLGPGDYCRLAFETLGSQRSYEIYYGGDPPESDAVPEWKNTAGLVLETREYRECNLNSLESVRSAFESSKRIGSDYVANVQHSYNPFSLKPEPFLSYYSGYLHIPSTGMYGFLTSSQDCSFLLIDGKLIVDAPGRHRPQRRALRGARKDIRLTAGPHQFEYYHAASGPEALMVAAWEVSPTDSKPQPKAIPSESFRSGSVGRVEAGIVSTRAARLVPDFLVGIAGDVPLPDNDLALIGVKFLDTSPKSLTLKARFEWDFGDGQTADVPDPVHVFLHPGLYTVKLTVNRGGKPFEMVNRVNIDRPILTKKDKLHELDDYLPILETYDPKTLDAVGLRQLVLAYQWKADNILAGPEEEDSEQDEPEIEQPPQTPDPEEVKKQKAARKAEAMEYISKAVEAGKAALLEESAAKGDEDLMRLVRLIGPMARDQLGESRLAGQIWHGASQRITRGEFKAECALEAADIALNDLVDVSLGKSLLDTATADWGQPIAADFGGLLRADGRRPGRQEGLPTGRSDSGQHAIAHRARRLAGRAQPLDRRVPQERRVRPGSLPDPNVGERVSRRQDRRLSDLAVRPILGRPPALRAGRVPLRAAADGQPRLAPHGPTPAPGGRQRSQTGPSRSGAGHAAFVVEGLPGKPAGPDRPAKHRRAGIRRRTFQSLA